MLLRFLGYSRLSRKVSFFLLLNSILSVPTWRWQEVGGSELGNGLPCLGIFRIQKGEFEFFFNNPFITVDFGNENVPFQRRKTENTMRSPRAGSVSKLRRFMKWLNHSRFSWRIKLFPRPERGCRTSGPQPGAGEPPEAQTAAL